MNRFFPIAAVTLIVTLMITLLNDRNDWQRRSIREQAATDKAIAFAELWKERAEMWSNSVMRVLPRAWNNWTNGLDHAYLTNSKDIFAYGVASGTNVVKPSTNGIIDSGKWKYGYQLDSRPFSSVSNVTCIGNGAGMNLTNSNVLLVGKGAQADRDWQLVIRFQDGSELRQDLPHVPIDMGPWDVTESSFEWEKP